MVDEGRAVATAYCTISCKILVKKLLMYGPDEQMVRWVENWLNGQAQRMMISSMTSSGRPGTSNVLQGSLLHPFNSTSLLMMWMMGQSAPSASSINIQNWEVWLIHQESKLSFRGTSTGKKNGPRSPKRNAKTSTRGGITPGPRTGSGPTSWKAAWQQRT